MQALYNLLITIEILTGIFILIIVVTSKGSSDGLVAKANTSIAATSVSPGTKLTRIIVAIFLVNSLLIAITRHKMQKNSSIIANFDKEVSKNLAPSDE
ncbi:hypothetical protein [Candidatus Deianiraea vastatrix]|uniref:Preprotein translocase subunit SecG n=1 Tax=Candidatus Deianiraea vastatrix TaxID=2163644 RepID=A0A5B8XFX0_9RICK|nr:hypothetical protein [Candidatus Deianiraea vastatrix]QED23816.1 preprotein translocase subunit SecG [Candidatus Deianiraea vastatrix]